MIWIYTAKISSWPTGSWIIALIGFGIDLICALDTIIVRIWGTVYGSLNYCQIVPFRKHCVFKFVIMLLLDCTSCHWTADHVNSFTLQVVNCASEVYYLHMVHFNQFLLFILCTGLFNLFCAKCTDEIYVLTCVVQTVDEVCVLTNVNLIVIFLLLFCPIFC